MWPPAGCWRPRPARPLTWWPGSWRPAPTSTSRCTTRPAWSRSRRTSASPRRSSGCGRTRSAAIGCSPMWPKTSSPAGSGWDEPRSPGALAGGQAATTMDATARALIRRPPAAAGRWALRRGVGMTRETDVVRSLVEMADTLVDDYDVVDLLTGVADRCVDLLGVSAAGVMLASPAGSLGLVASSSEAMRLLELFELQQQEGPCLDAFRTGERVQHVNLDAGSGRWPSFSAAARKAGFASASAVPLRLREVTLGALNLLSVPRAPMAEADLIVARAFADLATLSITQHRASAEAQRLNEQLSGALTSRVVIEQAKGVISERAGVDLAQAFSRLRAYARSRNLRLTDVARAAIDGTLDPLAWAAV